MQPPLSPVAFSHDGRFAHCSPPESSALTMSVCCHCGVFICASADERLLALVERLHRCPTNQPDLPEKRVGRKRKIIRAIVKAAHRPPN